MRRVFFILLKNPIFLNWETERAHSRSKIEIDYQGILQCLNDFGVQGVTGIDHTLIAQIKYLIRIGGCNYFVLYSHSYMSFVMFPFRGCEIS
jgi:hypothetical protein